MMGTLVLGALAASYLYLAVDLGPHEEYSAAQDSLVTDSLPTMPSAYGIPLAGFRVDHAKVMPGSTLGGILSPYGIGAGAIDSLVNISAPVFDINRMRAGHPIAFIFPEGNDTTPTYFVYETDPWTTWFSTCDRLSPFIWRSAPSTPWREKHKRGRVRRVVERPHRCRAHPPRWPRNSVTCSNGRWISTASKKATASPWCTSRTPWTKSYGQPELLGVRYEGDDVREAFLHTDASGVTSYFDAEGKSLRKAFLQAPLKYSRISSGFSLKRFHPVQHRMKAHLGTDYAAPYGTPIMSVGDGVVEKAGAPPVTATT